MPKPADEFIKCQSVMARHKLFQNASRLFRPVTRHDRNGDVVLSVNRCAIVVVRRICEPSCRVRSYPKTRSVSQALLRQDREVSSRCQDFVPHEVKTYHARSVADGAVAEMALNRFANIGPQFRQRISLIKDVVPERSCRIAAIGFVFMDFKHYFSRHGAVVPIMGATGIEPCRVKKVLLNSFSCQKKALARNSMRGSRNAACGVKPRARNAADKPAQEPVAVATYTEFLLTS